ncbi:MAG TPA: MFS transporter [Phototrophicaceae bacterium]|nr:MFS transporter [Phototrophicaceae bacterium]
MLRGMRGFTMLWFGQLVSELGSAMTRFAFVIWVWQMTGAATDLALLTLFGAVPSALVSLFAGSLVDRSSRKRMIILGNLGLALPTGMLLMLLLNGSLQVWHLYAAAAVGGVFDPVQSLAFQVSITTTVPKAQYNRANGMMSLNEYVSLIGAPLLAGLLLSLVGIEPILIIDMLTFFVAIIAVLFVRIPAPLPQTAADDQRHSIGTDVTFGFRYILQRPLLRGLLLLTVAFGFFEALGYPLLAPMILARTGSSEAILGIVQSVMGLSGLVGGLVVTFWGGAKRKTYAILIGILLTGLFGDALMGLGRSLVIWLVAGVFIECFLPLVLSSMQALWQSKVPPAAQGRVFAVRRLINSIIEPLSLILAGLLADHVFEPGMQPNGALAPIFGGVVGTGIGSGMALLLIICGVLCALTSLWGYAAPNIRDGEALFPDDVPNI